MHNQSSAQPPPAGMNNFFFRRRSGRLDWRSLLSIDLERVVETVDINQLQSIVENITFADLVEDDLYQPESHLLQLFRLSQLTIEYLLNVQNWLLQESDQHHKIAQQHSRELEAAKRAFVERESTTDRLKSELRLQRKVVKQYEKLTGTNIAALKKLQAEAIENKAKQQQQNNTTVQHTGERFPCRFCTAMFVSAAYVDGHIHRRHGDALRKEQEQSILNITLQRDQDEREKKLNDLESQLSAKMSALQQSNPQVEALQAQLKQLMEQQHQMQVDNERKRREDAENETARLRALLEQQQQQQQMQQPSPPPPAIEPPPPHISDELRDVDDNSAELEAERARAEAEAAKRLESEQLRLAAERREAELKQLLLDAERNQLAAVEEARLRAELEAVQRAEQLRRQKLQDEEYAERQKRMAADEAAEQRRQGLRDILTQRSERKYVMFADMPFLKARYEHTEDEVRRSLVAFHSVVQAMSAEGGDSALQELHDEIQHNDYAPQLQAVEDQINKYATEEYTVPAEILDHEKQLAQWQSSHEQQRQRIEQLKVTREQERVAEAAAQQAAAEEASKQSAINERMAELSRCQQQQQQQQQAVQALQPSTAALSTEAQQLPLPPTAAQPVQPPAAFNTQANNDPSIASAGGGRSFADFRAATLHSRVASVAQSQPTEPIANGHTNSQAPVSVVAAAPPEVRAALKQTTMLPFPIDETTGDLTPMASNTPPKSAASLHTFTRQGRANDQFQIDENDEFVG